MSIEFSQIPARLNYPKHIKGKLSSLHSDIITYVSSVYDGSHSLRNKTIQLLNTITKYVIDGDSFPNNWSSSVSPFDNIEIEDEFVLRDYLEHLYINPKDINWDIPIVVENAGVRTIPQPVKPLVPQEPKGKIRMFKETDKSDLYIQPPKVPQFDVSKPWISQVIGGEVFCIYTSIPEIPTKQNEISVTTNVNRMSESQLLNLFPNNFIKTRPPVMYEPRPEFKFHSQLGVLLPIEGFTEEELVDNIIRYPHLFKLSKLKDEEIISFYNTIEIDGKLHKISEIWKELPDTSKIPYTADFVKEYVVRRYLLERDVKKIDHTYPMYGNLDPFLTLFTTTSDYINWGYNDVVYLAKQCVISRVSYKQSRNPVLRRIRQNV